MSSIEKTAYPRFPKRRKIKPAELSPSYSLREDEINMIKRTANTDKSRFNLAIQLKTFQQLGYFVDMDAIPPEIIIYIRQSLQYHYRLAHGYGANNKGLYRHRQKIREVLNVKRWGSEDNQGTNIHYGRKQHIRYGRKGRIAYRHIADNYIALFSTFIQCGVWEAIHIIDGLLKNASEVQSNIVHSDTQGQSLPVFAFSYLLGIQLMPRIRNWKDLNLYRVDKRTVYTHIDSMFCESEIDWELLATHWQDLMQVIISVKLGKVSSAFILSKLNSYNNQNRLYKVFQELGKVIRTIFLLDYVSDKNLRQTITATTNKVESYHTLEDWIRFGSKYLVASNDPDEMEKAVKHNDLIANCIMLQNVIDITDICHALIQEGYTITEDDLSHMSPYMTEHIKRFGEYVLDLTSRPTNLYLTRNKFLFEIQDEAVELAW